MLYVCMKAGIRVIRKITETLQGPLLSHTTLSTIAYNIMVCTHTLQSRNSAFQAAFLSSVKLTVRLSSSPGEVAARPSA